MIFTPVLFATYLMGVVSSANVGADSRCELFFEAITTGNAINVITSEEGGISSIVSCERPDDLATPLMLAAAWNQLDTARQLLGAGVNVDARDINGDTALNWAAYYGNISIADLLLSAGADTALTGHGNAMEIALRRGHNVFAALIASHNSNDPSILKSARREAIASGNEEAIIGVELTQGNLSFEWTDSLGRSELFLAAENGRTNIVQHFIERGANLDQLGPGRMTPLMAALREGNSDIAIFLLEKGANPNLRTEESYLALTSAHFAAIGNAVVPLERILSNNPKLATTADRTGAQPLLWATFEGSREAAQVLIRHGGDPCHPNSSGTRALEIITARGWEDILQQDACPM